MSTPNRMGGELRDPLTPSVIFAFGAGYVGKSLLWKASEAFGFVLLTTGSRFSPLLAGALLFASLAGAGALEPVAGWLLTAMRRQRASWSFKAEVTVLGLAVALSFILMWLADGECHGLIVIASILFFRCAYAIFDVRTNALFVASCFGFAAQMRLSKVKATGSVTVSLLMIGCGWIVESHGQSATYFAARSALGFVVILLLLLTYRFCSGLDTADPAYREEAPGNEPSSDATGFGTWPVFVALLCAIIAVSALSQAFVYSASANDLPRMLLFRLLGQIAAWTMIAPFLRTLGIRRGLLLCFVFIGLALFALSQAAIAWVAFLVGVLAMAQLVIGWMVMTSLATHMNFASKKPGYVIIKFGVLTMVGKIADATGPLILGAYVSLAPSVSADVRGLALCLGACWMAGIAALSSPALMRNRAGSRLAIA